MRTSKEGGPLRRHPALSRVFRFSRFVPRLVGWWYTDFGASRFALTRSPPGTALPPPRGVLVVDADVGPDARPSLQVGRLSHRNPAYVLPALRRHLLQLLQELDHSADAQPKEESARLLGVLIQSCPRLVLPYVSPILKALVKKLRTHGVAAAPAQPPQSQQQQQPSSSASMAVVAGAASTGGGASGAKVRRAGCWWLSRATAPACAEGLSNSNKCTNNKGAKEFFFKFIPQLTTVPTGANNTCSGGVALPHTNSIPKQPRRGRNRPHHLAVTRGNL